MAKEITPSQKKIIIISLIVFLAFLIFWLFVYKPNKNTFKSIEAEFVSVENQINEIEAMIGKYETIEEGIRAAKNRDRELSSKFPQKEEDSLRMLSEFARKLNVEIISFKPQNKQAFMDGSAPIKIENHTCQRVAVSMEIGCVYNDLLRYIEAARDSLPAFVTIDKLRIGKEKPEGSRLKSTLELNLYFLS